MKKRRYALTEEDATLILTAIEIAFSEFRAKATESPYNRYLVRNLEEIYNKLRNYDWRKLK